MVLIFPERRRKGANISQVMAVPGSLDEFLRSAGDKLGVIARKAFTENGALLDDVGLIRDDEKVYISAGEPFWKADSTYLLRGFHLIFTVSFL